MDAKDVAIRTSGLLQAIIASGAPQEKWKELLQAALILHSETCKVLLNHKTGVAK